MEALPTMATIHEDKTAFGHKAMDIAFELELNQDEIIEVSSILDCSVNDLPGVLGQHIRASAKEYLSMYRGQKVFRRATDIHEFRLLLLIEETFSGRIPDEHEVTKLFQTTPSESRALIRSVLAKYQYKIKERILGTVRSTLQRATQEIDGGDYSVVIKSLNLVDAMNRLLADQDGSLHQVKKKRDSVSTYEIKPSSFEALAQVVGMEQGEI
jgi:hypothetical protein